ncbi:MULTISPECIES: DUF5065 family protein [Bacillus cereus group]|uniref:DUF5065 family protein n=1 Tax=Bacillus cereus group TaxID=86661 RepID=UPI0002411FCA|nr:MULTISPECIES: DUF5065 family protein [Bacillus cereus group]EHL65978.1 hypothetical protein HMPREF1014_05416 [Bacillus sp. 7_6_55CFAA_CT2]PFN26788.1 DUF5065 domain-containing protein [Bacillus cereus]TKJ03271.1 DUF5065 family protein [Bacillus cereus]
MKLGKLALVGVLTFGGFTAVEMIKPTSQAAAAYEEPYSDPYNDSWGFVSPNNFEYLSQFPNAHMIKKSYRTGDILNYSLSSIKDGPGAVMKIFKVEAGKKPVRYRTIYPQFDANHQNPTWSTVITDVYTPGSYIAVINHVNDSIGYGVSDWFTINK